MKHTEASDRVEMLDLLQEVVERLGHIGANYCDHMSLQQAKRFHRATEVLRELEAEIEIEQAETGQ